MKKLLSDYLADFGFVDLIIIAMILLLLGSVAKAQPQHIGALVNGQFEGSGSGNGTIAGFEIQNVDYLRIYGEDFKLATNATFTLDRKVYRNQFGGSVRAASLLRYSLKPQKVFFIQGGVQVGGIAFPDTPGSDDGYAKYIARPVAGAGIDFTRQEWSVVVDYQFHFKRKLLAQRNSLSDFKNRTVDGWTSGQRLGLAATIQLAPRWILLLNGATGWYTYQRNPAQYGAALGSVVHRFNAYELSLGVGRKY